MSKKTLTVREAAQWLGWTLNYAYVEVWAGRFPDAKKIDGRWEIPAEAVEERLKRRVS